MNNAEIEIFLPGLLVGFLMASMAPNLYGIFKSKTPYLLALLPITYFCYFLLLAIELPLEGIRFSVTPWIDIFDLDLAFRFDGLSLLFSLLVSFIGVIIILYSAAYLKAKQDRGRFYAFLLLFMVSMLGLVLADNLIVLFLFWELTTFSSFLLIGFDHHKKEARHSAWQAIIITTFGALAMLAGFLLLAEVTETFNITKILTKRDLILNHELFPLSFVLILLGALTKSAQFPFYFWLPGAMSAPTPISAYLHSVTLVKAGIYLLCRFLPVLGNNPLWFYTLTTIGSLTALVGAIGALKQIDLKLILAYLTVCSLGLMVILLGVGTAQAATALVVYLLSHSLYKCSLFLVVGGIDHCLQTRKVSELSGLFGCMPKTSLAGALALIAMMALPPSLGFLGKEMSYKALLNYPILIFISVLSLACAIYIAINLLLNVLLIKTVQQKKMAEPFLLWGGPLLLSSIVILAGSTSQWLEVNFIKSVASSMTTEGLIKKVFPGIKVDIVLGLSILTIILGAFIYLTSEQIKKLIFFLRLPAMPSPSAFYQRLKGFILLTGKAVERTSLEGYYHKYMISILVTSIIALAFGLGKNVSILSLPSYGQMDLYEWGLVLLIISSTLSAIFIGRLITAVMILGVLGFSIAIIFVSYGAPDLALTQLLIETLTIILFALIAVKFPHRSKHHFSSLRTKIDLILSLTFGSLISILLLSISATPYNDRLSRFFGDYSLSIGKGRNVVNVILVDFRALDTLGEITVLFIAGLGFYSLLKLVIRRKQT